MLSHPEIQEDVSWCEILEKLIQKAPSKSPKTLATSREIRDLGKDKSPGTKRLFAITSKVFGREEFASLEKNHKIAQLTEEIERLKKGKKRKKIPNPNQRFMDLTESLSQNNSLLEAVVEELEDEEGGVWSRDVA